MIAEHMEMICVDNPKQRNPDGTGFVVSWTGPYGYLGYRLAPVPELRKDTLIPTLSPKP